MNMGGEDTQIDSVDIVGAKFFGWMGIAAFVLAVAVGIYYWKTGEPEGIALTPDEIWSVLVFVGMGIFSLLASGYFWYCERNETSKGS